MNKAAKQKVRNSAEEQDLPLPVRIRRAYRQLGDAQRQVAQYIQDHPHEVAFLTSTRLAELNGVSESTVVRLAMSLGYSGYPELQRTIQKSLREVALKQHAPAAVRQAPREDDPMRAQLAAEQANLDATILGLSDQSLTAAVSLLIKAQHIYIVGVRQSFAPAYVAWALLNRILKKATLLTMTGGSLRDEVLGMTKDDVLLAIATPRYAMETVQVFEHACRVQASTIAITDSLLSPLADRAEEVLLFHHLTPNFFNSSLGALAIVHALAAGMVGHPGIDSEQLLEELETVHRHFRLHPGRNDQKDTTS